MEIRIPANENFDFYACKKLYKKYQNLIGDDVSFNQIIKNTFFYSFYQNKKLIGCIYIFEKYKKLYMNGFAIRGFHNFNIKAVKKIFEWFNTNIYAESNKKPAIYLLLKCGFKKISYDLFVYYKKDLCQKGM